MGMFKEKVEKLASRSVWENARHPAVFLLSCAALLMAVYALLLPAITADREFAVATDSDVVETRSWGEDAGEQGTMEEQEGLPEGRSAAEIPDAAGGRGAFSEEDAAGSLASGSDLAAEDGMETEPEEAAGNGAAADLESEQMFDAQAAEDLEAALSLASGSDLAREPGDLGTESELVTEEGHLATESNLPVEMPYSGEHFMASALWPAGDTGTDGNEGIMQGADFKQAVDVNLHARLRSGASLNRQGDYVWAAGSPYAGHAFVFRLSFAMSGLWEQEAGAVEIRLPAGILLDRDGQAADDFELSIPSDGEEGLGEGNPLVYRQEGEEIVIYNRLPLSSAEQFYIEVSYTATEPSFAYADYDPEGQGAGNGNPKNGSRPFQASLFLHGEACALSEAIPVYMDTNARIAATTLNLPAYYTEWQGSWGERPEDAEDWYYLVWEARSILRDATQPYDFFLSADFAPQDPAGASLGDVVAYKMQGDAAFVPAGDPEAGIVRGLRSSYPYGRYDYVLTRHRKSAYEGLESYTLSNAVTACVVPADGADRESSASGGRAWTFETKVFAPPSGRFYMYKWGLDYSGSKVADSEHIRRFTLSEFMDEGNTAVKTIGDLAYYSYVEGYPGRQTVAASGDAENPEDYWQEAVAYELTDSAFYLKSIGGGNGYTGPLSQEDYQIDSLQLNCYARDARFDENAKQFVSSGSADYTGDGPVRLFLQINGERDAEGGAVWRFAGSYSMEDGSFSAYAPPETDGTGGTADAGDPDRVSGIEGVVTQYAGRSLSFANTEGCIVTGFRLSAESAHYYTHLGAWPHVSLKHSGTVDRICGEALDLEAGGQSKIALRNTASAALYQADGSKFMQFSRSGEEYAIGLKRHGSLRLAVAAYLNQKLKKQYRVSWEAESGESYLVEGNRRVSVRQEGGCFYALLPRGGAYLKDSLLCYADGQRISEGDYEAEILRNYQGSDQALLIVRFLVPAASYRFRYTTVHPWDTIQEYGEAVYSDVAYETGNGDIGDGRTKASCVAAGGILLAGRSDAAEGAKKFLYTRTGHAIHALTAASLGLYKKVMAGEDSDYSYESQVSLDEVYTYRIRFAATDEVTGASDLIVFDALENYVPASDADGGDWRGSLQAIVVGKQHEYGMRPVFYYREDVPDFQEIEEALGASIGGGEAYSLAAHGWTDQSTYLSEHGDLSGVRAFAIDLRASAEEGKPFSLGPDQAVSITVYMRSPAADNTHAEDPVAYNNVHLYSTITHEDLLAPESGMIHQEYTTVHLRATGAMELLKVDSEDPGRGIEGVKFQLRGRSAYGTEVDQLLSSNRLGKISFPKIEKGNYTLQEVDGIPDYQQDHTLMSVSVSGDGRIALGGAQGEGMESGYPNVLSAGMDEGSGIYKMSIANEPRVHGELHFTKKGMIDGSDARKPLRGATFQIQGVSDYGNDILLYASSGVDGEVVFPNIEMGKYALSEFQAADGYICMDEVYTVRCGADGNVRLYGRAVDGSEVEMDQEEDGGETVFLNEPYHGFRLLKRDAVNQEVLEGAAFLLSGISDYGSPVEQRQRSDQNGVVAFTGLEPGKYVLREVEAPPRHLLDPAERLVQIDARGEVRIEGLEAMAEDGFKGYFAFENERVLDGTLTVTKTWAGEEGEKPLPVLYLDSKEPVFGLPTASIDRDSWNQGKSKGILGSSTASFTRDQEKDLDWLKANALRIDDKKTKYSVYLWAEGASAYWWSDAAVIYLPSDCTRLFQSCRTLESLDLSDFDTSRTTNMSYMFEYCSGLTELNLSSFDTSKVSNMYSMFSVCTKLPFIDLSGFDTRNVTDMAAMFYGCSSMPSLDLGSFRTEKVKNFSYMFYGCTRLTSLDVSNFDTRSAEKMQYMFYSVESVTELHVKHFYTGNVGDMTAMFSRCFKLESLDLQGWDTSKLTGMMMIFSECHSLESLEASDLDTSHVSSYYMVFHNCRSLKTLDISGWDSGNVVDMTYTLSGCGSLRTVYVGDAWSTAKVKYPQKMFLNSGSLVGGQGTVYDRNHIDAAYARVDGGPDSESPGYLSRHEEPEDAAGGSDAPSQGNAPEGDSPGSAEASELLADGGARPLARRMPYAAAMEEGRLLSNGGQQDGSAAGVSSQQVSRDTIWHGEAGEEADAVYGQWIENGDGSWTYRFKVYDMDADYYLWEGALPGYTAEYALEDGAFAAGESLKVHYQAGNEARAYVRNSWTGEEDGTGNLLIRKEVEGAEPDEAESARKFTFHIQLSSPLTNYYGDVLFKRGSATVQLAHRQSIWAVGLPAGVSYEVSEEAQDGYTLTASGESGTILSGETCIAEFLNKKADGGAGSPLGTLRIEKDLVAKDASIILTEEERQRKFLFSIRLSGEGAEDVDGIYGGLVFARGEASFYLADQGVREIPGLPAGLRYTVREETEEAGGYEVFWTAGQREGSGAEVSGTVPEGGAEEIAFSNQKNENARTGGFVLRKTVLGRDSGQGFPFYISFSGLRGNTLYTYGEGDRFLSDARGEARVALQAGSGDSIAFPGLPEGASYTITEEANAYIPSFTAYEAGGSGRLLSMGGKGDAAGVQLSTAREKVEDGEEAVFSFQNQSAVFELFFQKLDADGGGLAGALLQIYDQENDALLREWESSGESDRQELAEGLYRLHEASAPEGYRCAEDILFAVGEGGKLSIGDAEAQTVVMLDLPVKLGILKVDEETRSPLPGALLQLLDGDTVVETWFSGQEELILGGKLAAGREYRLREKKAPDGYVASEDICFILRKDGSIMLTEAPEGALEQVESADGAYPRIVMRDRRGMRLPSTGSTGTGRFQYLGLCLLFASFVLGYCYSKRQIFLSFAIQKQKRRWKMKKSVKKGKRMMPALLCVLFLHLLLASTGFSEDRITISVNTEGQLQEDKNDKSEIYTAYRIFDVAKGEGVLGNHSDGTLGKGGEGYSYTISDGSAWYPVVRDYLTAYIQLSPIASDSHSFTVSLQQEKSNTDATAKAIAAILEAHIPAEGAGGRDFSSGTPLSVPPGYYLIRSSLGTNLILATTDIAITEKSTYPSIEKTVERADYSVGEMAQYTIKVSVPQDADPSKYMYVTDRMAAELRFDEEKAAMQAVIGETETAVPLENLSAENSVDRQYIAEDATFQKKFRIRSDMLGKTVLIRYQAELCSSAQAKTEYLNQARLDYSNYRSSTVTARIRTFGFTVMKTNTAGALLHGAGFTLRSGEPAGTAKAISFIEDGNGYVKADSDDPGKSPELLAGEIRIRGLSSGTYYLFETQAPAGYNILKKPIVIEIDANGNVTVDAEHSDSQGSAAEGVVTVVNHSGMLLPSTGGMGTRAFAFLGSAILLLAFALVAVRKAVKRR